VAWVVAALRRRWHNEWSSIVGEAGPELVIPLDRLRNFGLGTSPSLLVGHYGPETDAAMYKAIMALYGVALPAGLSALGGPAGFSLGEGLMSLIVGGVAAARQTVTTT